MAAQHSAYDEWKRDINEYTKLKKEFQGVAEPYKKVTQQYIKAQDVLYNPITQKYTSNNVENQMKKVEDENMLKVLAQNKVSSKLFLCCLIFGFFRTVLYVTNKLTTF